MQQPPGAVYCAFQDAELGPGGIPDVFLPLSEQWFPGVARASWRERLCLQLLADTGGLDTSMGAQCLLGGRVRKWLPLLLTRAKTLNYRLKIAQF